MTGVISAAENLNLAEHISPSFSFLCGLCCSNFSFLCNYLFIVVCVHV